MGEINLKNYKLIALFSLLCIMILVPATYAMDNQTAVEAVDENDVISDEYYFDANISDNTGDGSIDNPYKEFTSNKVKSNSIIHLNDGEYNFDHSVTVNNVTIIGQNTEKTIVKYNDLGFTASGALTLQNLTLVNLAISDRSNSIIKATNVIFRDYTITPISTSFEGTEIFLENCTFSNNHATSGGAININNGSLEILNSLFINNYANRYGGAIYIRESDIILRNVEIVNSTSLMGGAITSVYTNININNLTSRNNNAKYGGGVIYALFGSLSLNNSILFNNSAQDGGALFVDEVNNFIAFNNTFTNNTAIGIAGAVYSAVSRNLNRISVLNESLINSFSNNYADFENDVYECEAININYNSGNYMLIQSGPLYDSELPSCYDLRNNSGVTPVKSQGSNGNCWAFASLASLESCILKATGEIYDLSEANMKNIMSMFSSYGWQMETNKGGYDRMGYAYLVSWLGPVNENQDNYIIGEVLSPVLNSLFHVQNILFLKRTSYTDNDEIKRAIMSYGAVSTSIHWPQSDDGTDYYRNGKNIYWYRTDKGANHAVAIVGWDDNYSKNNFKTTPPGDGAWIIKNSWGAGSGENGYYYVSYYDTKLAPLNSPHTTYVFLFNESIKYDKNYQYDVSGRTDFFLNESNTVWYKNRFVASDNEYLTAVSTYFEKDASWDLSIYVNNLLRHTQSGTSTPSYSTIELNKFIPMNIGDIFEIEFKVTMDKEASFPISEGIISNEVPINKRLFHENISFVSYDGENWADLYDLSWTYSSHTYSSQVACIKAFTILNEIKSIVNVTLNITDTLNIQAKILNEYGFPVNSGNITFTVEGKNYTVGIVKGIATLNLNLTSGEYNISTLFEKTGYLSMQKNFTVEVPFLNTTVSIDINPENPVNIYATVLNEYGYGVKRGNVTFVFDDGSSYVVNVSDGRAEVAHIFKTVGNHNVSAVFNSLYYHSSSSFKEFNVSLINTTVELVVDSEFNPVKIHAIVKDQYGNLITMGNVTFSVNGISHTVNVTNGIACLNHDFNTPDLYNVSAIFNQDYCYNSSGIWKLCYLPILKTYISIVVNIHNPITIEVSVLDEMGNNVNCGNVTFVLDEGNSSTVNITEFSAHLTRILEHGKHNVSVVFNPISYYNSSSSFMEFNVSLINTTVELVADNEFNPVNIHAIVKDQYGKLINNGSATFIVDNAQHVVDVVNGSADLTEIFENIGLNNIYAKYNGLDYYYNLSSESKDINVYSSVISSDDTKTYNSQYEVKLLDNYGNPLNNTEIKFVIGTDTYNVKTNGNGIAKLNIDLGPGNYNISIINPINGEVKIQTIKVMPRITENKDLTMYYGAGKYYKVRVFDDAGNIARNVQVIFTVNKVKYARTTDSNGYAYLKITKNPGKYTVTAEYKGFKVYNRITVKTTIVTKNIKVKKGKTIKFTAKLLNKNGKILKNKKITFKFKGKTYKVKTNKKGIATLKITKKYKKGKYAITSCYGKLKIKNTIKIK